MSTIRQQPEIEIMIERLAYQLAENHSNEKELYLLGIKQNGLTLANNVATYLQKILDKKTQIHVAGISIDKKNPEKNQPISDIEISKMENKTVIIIDDVINSGRTIFYILKPFFDLKLTCLQLLVLVERKYKRFPIKADYVGMALNTTLKDHIEVKTQGELITSINLN